MAGRSLLTTMTGAILAGLALAPAAGAATPPPTDGAPLEATVRMTSELGLPPAAYSLVCTNLPNCSTSGQIDLATTAEVPVAYAKRSRSTQGIGPLPYSLAQGSVGMTFSCEGSSEPFVSTINQGSTQPGELEIAKVSAVPNANALSIALNTAGDTGTEFPQEFISRNDGGCDTPFQSSDLTYGLWYFHFYNAHRDAQQDITNDLEIKDLTYEDGVFRETFLRTVQIGAGTGAYPIQEFTEIEVEPEFCTTKRNRISSATANGESLGLDGSSFYPGQLVHGPPGTRIKLGDGSIIEMEKGGKYVVESCDEGFIETYLGESVKSLLIDLKRLVSSGSVENFTIETERAVAGVRGTVFELSYNEPKELTRIAVEEGSVSLKGINGAKGKVIVEAGEVGIQKGKKSPVVKG